MLIRLPKRRDETFEEMRVRLITETSLFITECLQHPELIVRIPIIPAGWGRFPPSLTQAFWDPILSE
jgi:hypothetical protein